MIFLNDGIEHLSKVLVAVPVTSVDATVLIVKHSSTGDGLLQGEARSGSLVGAEFLEASLSNVLGYKTVFGLDLREEWENAVLLLKGNVFLE